MTQRPSSTDDQDKMMNESPQAKDRQAQVAAQRLALVLLASSIMALPFFYILAAQWGEWQLTALIYINIPFVVASSVGLWLARRGRVALSISVMLGVMGLVVVAASALISRIGIIAGLGFPLLTFYIASRTMTGRDATRINIFGVLVGITSIAASLFSQSTQISILAVQVAVPVMALILIVTSGITVFRQFPAYPLRVKLVLILLGVALFSISAVAFATNQVISREVQQQAGASLSALAKGKALEIGAIVNRDKNTLESLVINAELQGELRAVNAKSTSDPAYLALLDEQWQAALDETDPLLQSALNNYIAEELREYQGRFPEFVEIFLTNKYGGNIASTNRTTDYYQADEGWWQAAWNNGMGGLYISQPQFDESTGLYAIDIALPVYYESSSEIIGILRATVDVTALKDTLRAGEFGRTGSVDLVFPDGQFLHGDPDSQVLHMDTESVNQLASLQQAFGTFDYEGQPSLVSKQLVSASSANDRDTVESLGWYLVTHQDSAEALAPAAALIRTTVLTALAVLLLASALAFYFGRQLTTPVSQLTSAAARVSEGDLTVQASVTSQDEIGTLAATFNSMTGQLRTLIDSMEQRVAERTRDLELASEVGRTVSEKVADLQLLLSDAVELIRDRFDLYYTQIYLVEPDGRTLKLRAGTGDVGKILLQRGHHLRIGSGSINGRAAANKRAVIVADTAQSPTFLPNPLLPNTHSEMAVPLISGDRVVGVLDMQSERPGALSGNELSAFETLAAQLAIAIQNATLFAEAQQSRMEVEAQARRLTRTGWQDFLNAVERSEQLGYVFDQEQVLSLESANPVENEPAVSVPIMITGEQVGTLQIVGEPGDVSTSDTVEITRSTAAMLANQIENLRLFSQAERYRAEAEEIARRLTREGWESYLRTRQALADGYVYDLNAVQAVSMSSNGKGVPEFTRPVVVRDEVIGELAVDHFNGRDEEAVQVVAAVAEQLSEHIENLRLLEEAERRRIEIEQGEARLAEALAIARLAHWEYDHVKDIFTFNDHFFSIFHTTAAQEGGYTLSSMEYATRFVHPDDMPLVGGEIAKAMAATGRFYNVKLEHRVIYRDGGTGYISVDVNVERDEQGNITRFYGANQDITERRKTQELLEQRARELEEAQTFLNAVIENLPTMLFVKEAEELRFVRWNKAEEELVGYKREDIIGKNDYDLFPKEQADVFTENDRQVLASGQMLDIPEEPLATALQGMRFLHTRKVPIHDVDGKAKYLLGVSEDITERKLATEALARRATELATVAQVSTTASTVLDPDKLLQAVVDLTKESFGLYHVHVYLLDNSWNTLLLASGAGEVGRRLVAEEHSISLAAEQSLVARAARSGDVIIVNDVRSEAGFLPNPLLPDTQAEMAVPMIVGDRVLGVFDVQSIDPKGFSVEDASIYTTLASQVAVALQNARLYVEQSATVTQLRELDRLKSSFLANMSHELRTPLNSILGFADVMLEELDGPLTENMDNDLRLIQKNGQHLLHLINDVLDMAKIEAGRMNLNPEKFKVYEVLDEVTSITSTLASEKNLCLYIEETSDRNVEVYADHTRLRQVMINLVNNAIKFTEKGKIALKVEPMEGARVLISVRDTGIGIPPDKLEAVFLEFTQVDTSSTRKAGGTGLGLPISRKLVEMHGGRLWVESTGVNGEGSVFYVELPVEARITEVIEKTTR